MANPSSNDKPLAVMLAVVVAATVWSAIDPYDYATWFFELFIGAGGIVALVLLRKRFPMSALVLGVAALHYVVLAMGAKYTYAEEPIFSWLRDTFDLTVVLVEHNMQVVMGVCEEIHVLDHGETIAHGNPEEIKQHPKVLAAYLGEEDEEEDEANKEPAA